MWHQVFEKSFGGNLGNHGRVNLMSGPVKLIKIIIKYSVVRHLGNTVYWIRLRIFCGGKATLHCWEPFAGRCGLFRSQNASNSPSRREPQRTVLWSQREWPRTRKREQIDCLTRIEKVEPSLFGVFVSDVEKGEVRFLGDKLCCSLGDGWGCESECWLGRASETPRCVRNNQAIKWQAKFNVL